MPCALRTQISGLCIAYAVLWMYLRAEAAEYALRNERLKSAYTITSGVSVSLISALSGTQLFLVCLLAVVLLREPITRTEMVLKGVGSIGMTLGIYWLMQ